MRPRRAVPFLCALCTIAAALFSNGQERPNRPQADAPATAPRYTLSAGPGLQSGDLYLLKTVDDVQLSPDGSRVAYSVQHFDRPGRPYTHVTIAELGSGKTHRLGADGEGASSPRWSPDSTRIAYLGRSEKGSGIFVAKADGGGATFVVPLSGTNHPLPSSGERLSWSPDGTRIAFVSATPGPETEDAGGDPMVITRYLYKPTASEGLTRFNDNRRLHLFVVDVASKQVRQLTDGRFHEHSIAWSPRGDQIAFLSNREPDPDRFFNYDVFTVSGADATVRQLTRTKNAEYRPAWSPDGRTIAYLATKRPLTSSETTMEDTHVWLMDADGGNRRELGVGIDNRQGAPQWMPDGRGVGFTVQERGSVSLYRLSTDGGDARRVAPVSPVRGSIGSWSLASGPLTAYALTTPSGPAELYVAPASGPARAVTESNRDLLSRKTPAEVESFTFPSGGLEVEAFLTKPLVRDAGSKQPMIVVIKGGPHGQQGPHWNSQAQVYAARGWATLMVNYRGSTGYGQRFADAIFNDQNGAEARDVLAGVDEAMRRYPWIDAERLGVEGRSYGGQLTNWLVTQTDRFRAGIAIASIANLVSFNYMAYYHDYLAVEFGVFPHEMWKPDDKTPPRRLMDFLWERSPLRHVANVRTPVMLAHGENDNDVPIAEAEQFYIALKDVGAETIMVRYPREGHGIRETSHVVDLVDRSVAWYERHFSRGRTPTVQP